MGYAESTDENAYTYDPELAQQYLDAWGGDPSTVSLDIICSNDTKTAIATIIQAELAELGFDEVVFDQFVMPDSQNIVYDGDRQEATAAAAQAIRTQLEGSSIRVSFGSSAAQVAASADRVYLATDSGSQVEGLVEPLQDTLADVTTQIVFCTASRDTRFDGYSLLRPLIESDTAQE